MTVKAFAGASDRVLEDPEAARYVQAVLERLHGADHYVELRIFSTRSAMRTALIQELEGLVASEALAVPDFATFHEAFAGYPRIWVSIPDLDLGSAPCRARLQHEVGHAVLHWEISSYLLGLPRPLRDAVATGSLTPENASLIGYLLSVGVKDFEVSGLLSESGFQEDQAIFYASELSEQSGEARDLLDALTNLKVVLGALPFRLDSRVGDLLEAWLRGLGGFEAAVRGILCDLLDSVQVGLTEKIDLAAERIVGCVDDGIG